MEAAVPEALIRDLSARLTGSATEVDGDGQSSIGLLDAVDLSLIWIDSTCGKLDIHYPTDWILLRDVIVISLLELGALIPQKNI